MRVLWPTRRSLLFILLSATPALASSASPSAAGEDPPQANAPRLVIASQADIDLEFLALITGTIPAGQISSLGRAALAAGPGMDESDLALVADALTSTPGTELVVLDGRSRSPETENCDAGSLEGVQQCTIGFLDGAPSIEKYSTQSWLDTMGVYEAQDSWLPLSPIVAVIDSGIDPAHPALAGRLAGDGWDYILDAPGAKDEPNGIDDDGDGYADEAFGHGTHVASTIVLVAPTARILPYRVVDADGNGWAFNVARAVMDAVFSGANVINLSLSVEDSSKALTDALNLAVTFGVDVVTSAGNTASDNVLYPANMGLGGLHFFTKWMHPHGVIAVTAVDEHDVLAPFAAWGSSVDLAAPGVDIYGALPGGAWGWWSGTSMATAVASGSAALVQSRSGFYFFFGAGERLIKKSVSIDDQNPGMQGQLGGRIDLEAAVGSSWWF